LEKVELIPVIEITNYGQDLKGPEKGPYWEYPDEYEAYNGLSNKVAGFPEEMNSYLKGSSFYRLNEIKDKNLTKLVKDEIEEARKEGEDLELVCKFSGGYVLRIDDRDVLFPQCCSDLGNIKSWEHLIKGQEKLFYQGHPAPEITIEHDTVIFNLDVGDKYYDQFVPTPIEKNIEVNINDLKNAIEKAYKELEIFCDRLLKINEDENLNIPDIEQLLIFGAQ
jgi:hypothetical protein